MQDIKPRSGAGALFRALVLLVAAALLALTLVPAAQAAEEPETTTVIPLGRAVGIKLFAQGVLVVGLSDITTDQGVTSPARACGLQ